MKCRAKDPGPLYENKYRALRLVRYPSWPAASLPGFGPRSIGKLASMARTRSERNRAAGEPARALGCENQYQMESASSGPGQLHADRVEGPGFCPNRDP